MIIENFRHGDPLPVYRRFRDRGRLAPEGLSYVSSWVTEDRRRCYQVMESGDRALLDQWMAQWSELVAFEVIPVMTSAAAAQLAALELDADTRHSVCPPSSK
ncbi:MAG: DUF3303 family protein [Gemmatimonadaceae bacterium]